MGRVFPNRETLGMLAERERQLSSALDLVLERRRWGREATTAFHIRALQKLLAFANERVPLYRDKFQAANFRPEELHSLDDLSRVPFLTKDDLRQNDLSRLKPVGLNEDVRLLSSSGSTGIASKLFRDEISLAYFTAYDIVLYYEWCEGKPLAEAVYFLDIVPGSIDAALADWLRTTVPESRIASSSEPVDEQISRIERLRPEFISSYPSTLRNISMRLDQRGKSYKLAKLLHATSEMLDAKTKMLLKKVFPNAKIEQTYTSTEAGLIAYQCHEGRWHLCEEAAIYEVVDPQGRPTDELGELVVTNLMNWATPVIRYRGLGDLCRWDHSQCRCGSQARSLAQLEGRATESLFKADGSFVTPFEVTNALEEVSGIYQFQIIQPALDQIEILAVAERSSKHSEHEIAGEIKKIVEQLFTDATRCDVCFVGSIPCRTGSHKTPLVISLIARVENAK